MDMLIGGSGKKRMEAMVTDVLVSGHIRTSCNFHGSRLEQTKP